MLDKCVCCGAEVPEGRQICPLCERNDKRLKGLVKNPIDVYIVASDDGERKENESKA